MLSLLGKPARLCDGVSRREWLRMGGLSLVGLSLADLVHARQNPTSPPPNDTMFGRAKNVIWLYLSGGPPQHETFDPKPHAAAEVRGPYRPISTNVPGIQFCELLPRTAGMADRLAVVRSMYTNNNIHGGSGYWVATGRRLSSGTGADAQPTDWPNLASIVKAFRPSETLPALSAVTIPEQRVGNGRNIGSGQNGRFLGPRWSPEFIRCDPSAPDLQLGDQFAGRIPAQRLAHRASLLGGLEHMSQLSAAGRGAVTEFRHYQTQVLDLLTSGRARAAFRIEQEPVELRERYGMHHWGQSVLLARRLIEAGVRFVTVNWPREPGDRGTDNPLWDTHARNFDRMEDVLAPQFDHGFTALVDDLAERGLLDETLVVAVGEFGRTPRINAKAGRDHWGNVFSCVLAGAGVAGGQVYGASDRNGAEPADKPVTPGSLAATIFHLCGINYQGVFLDPQSRPLAISDQEPLFELLGAQPATSRRVAATGDPRRVPPYRSEKLLYTDFAAPAELTPATGPGRPKGWTAWPPVDSAHPGFGVRLDRVGAAPDGRTVIMGMLGPGGAESSPPAQGAQAVLAQRIASPTAGNYIVRLSAQGGGADREFYERVFLRNFSLRLSLFQFTERTKSPLNRRELAVTELRPAFQPAGSPNFELFRLEKLLANASFGMNFSFGLGIGVAVVIERLSDGPLELGDDTAPRQAVLRVDSLELEFQPKLV